MMPSHLLQTTQLSLDALRDLAHSQRLYAILDACDAPSVPDKVEELGETRAVSLYRGMAEEEYSAFAPYLAHADADLVDWIAANLWHDAWGVFVVFDGSLPALRSHFRHFLIVDDPQGEEMYFRFYDPRVLRKYLPTCTSKELAQFYGGIEAFMVSDPADPAAVEAIAQAKDAAIFAPVTSSVVTRIRQRFPIREPQMAAFGPEAEAAFEGRLIAHLHEHHADAIEGLSDDMLLPMARTGVARARNYGMTWESNLTAFVALMFEIAPNWDAHPRMQLILNSRNLDSETKMNVLIERTPEETWHGIAQRSARTV